MKHVILRISGLLVIGDTGDGDDGSAGLSGPPIARDRS